MVIYEGGLFPELKLSVIEKHILQHSLKPKLFSVFKAWLIIELSFTRQILIYNISRTLSTVTLSKFELQILF